MLLKPVIRATKTLKLLLKAIVKSCEKTTCLINYRISSIERRASNKPRPLISAAPFGIHIEISAAPLSAALIRIVTIFY